MFVLEGKKLVFENSMHFIIDKRSLFIYGPNFMIRQIRVSKVKNFLRIFNKKKIMPKVVN